jgi:DNA-binding transcriptional ArsR family regulator
MYCGGMGHETEHRTGTAILDGEAVEQIAETMHALSTPSRVRILVHLQSGPCSVGDLAAAVGMEQSAVSHQLRVLRYLRLVVGQRDGRHVLYELHDSHVGVLLEEAMNHVAHLRLGPGQDREPAS